VRCAGDPEFCEWRWVPLSQTIADEVVPFKRRVYAEVIAYGLNELKLTPGE
jgi:hypothetical protein